LRRRERLIHIHLRRAFALTLVSVSWVAVCQAQTPTVPPAVPKNGAELYDWACVACHGPDGTGALRSDVGFDAPLPDFSDCRFATTEPDHDWASVIHLGGNARALDRHMPAFGDALSDAEIASIVEYLRGFCRERGWPRGDLNLPRALVTEKAFPENEALMTTTFPAIRPDSVQSQFVYERRIGRRGQYGVVVPFNIQQGALGWRKGLGDLGAGFKYVVFDRFTRGVIASVGSEMTFPTGKEAEGLGNRLTVFEPFGAISQRFAHEIFVHVSAGFRFPLNLPVNDEFYWHAAVGTSLHQERWGRTWSPIVEILSSREFEFGESASLALLPQMQVTLSRRQHVKFDGGLRIPLNRRGPNAAVMMSLRWDWFEGGLFSGWTGR
jgi:mono/diheme cytochrome c family protein